MICENCKIEYEPKSHRIGTVHCSKKCSYMCRVGHFKKSESTRNKMSKKHNISPEVHLKMSNRAKSRKSHLAANWQGGLTTKRQMDMITDKYREWRKSVFERDNYTCKMCGQVGGAIQADHIKPYAFYPEVRYDINNGQTLCLGCHKKTPTYLMNRHKYVKLTLAGLI